MNRSFILSGLFGIALYSQGLTQETSRLPLKQVKSDLDKALPSAKEDALRPLANEIQMTLEEKTPAFRAEKLALFLRLHAAVCENIYKSLDFDIPFPPNDDQRHLTLGAEPARKRTEQDQQYEERIQAHQDRLRKTSELRLTLGSIDLKLMMYCINKYGISEAEKTALRNELNTVSDGDHLYAEIERMRKALQIKQ